MSEDKPLALIKEMAHESGGNGVPVPGGGTDKHITPPPQPVQQQTSPPPPSTDLQHQIMQLKKQQQLQQQILLQHFQQEQQRLAQEHEAQLQRHLKQLWEQQKAQEREAREAREARERRDRIDALRKKDKHDHCANASNEVKQKLQVFLMQKKQAAQANGTVPGSPFRNWGVVKSSSGESITSGVNNTHPYRIPAPAPTIHNKYDSSDFPLRKTASEPNMLKVRLKARVIDRRASPMSRRPHGKHRQPVVLKHHMTNCDNGSPRASPTSAPIREEEEEYSMPRDATAPPADAALFSSPSMPNISLGRPPPAHTIATHSPPAPALPAVTEAEPASYVTPPAAHVGSHPRRPLGRTQSAPLPLGDPALAGPAHHNHHLLRQQIRRTVLTRAHDARRLREEDNNEVIDLSAREAAPLCRAASTPQVVTASVAPTGLAYDALMQKHGCACGAHAPAHPEHGGRLQSVWARLGETGLAARCERTRPRKAGLEEIQMAHTEAHSLQFGSNPLARHKELPTRRFVRLACGGLGVDSDTAWNEHTAAASRLAAGAVWELAGRTALGELRNGFAVVRPPGHHAEPDRAMGFCFFNSVAIAAKMLRKNLSLHRILIVDWDVHHGNGTQQIFYDDPHVLYISIHRHDDGNFFPGTGGPAECGSGSGLGFNVNLAWSGGLDPPHSDAEYLAAFRTIVMPIAREYAPEIVLVSCGFDAARGHPPPLGGYTVSPACFAYMTSQLMTLANGKVVLALEGGYELAAICDCVQEVVATLLGDQLPLMDPAELARPPNTNAQDTLHKTIAIQMRHWPCVQQMSRVVGISALQAGGGLTSGIVIPATLQAERDAADTVSAMASLSVRHLHQQSPESSREVSEEPMEQDEGK